MLYHRSPYKHFRTQNPYGPVKVSVAITQLENERGKGIHIRTQCLSDKEIDGWDCVKRFKDQKLYRMDAHYSSEVFMGIMELLNEFSDDIHKEV